MKSLKFYLPAVLLSTALPPVFAQPVFYNGSNATGQLVLVRTVNAMQVASTAQALSLEAQGFGVQRSTFGDQTPASETAGIGPEIAPQSRPRRPVPMPPGTFNKLWTPDSPSSKAGSANMAAANAVTFPPSLTIVNTPPAVGFNGLTHRDQRLASNGNQFSVEPPNTSIAVGNGYVLEGVNNAVQVYDTAGNPLLPKVLASNELFGVSPAINRATGAEGVFPTDMRVFYDAPLNRWFVLQRSQDNDIFGNLLTTSRYYLAVSQTGNPTGTYNIYVMETTNASYPGCPCVADYPMIGADQYGIYISANQYQSIFDSFIAANILAISKASLEVGAAAPTAFKFNIPFTAGDEFTLQPAVTPPGASYFLANGGVEFLVSTRTSGGNVLALWALTNTSSLGTTPNLLLTKVLVPSQSYFFPPVATQPNGPNPYGSSLFPPAGVPRIESGDIRALSLMYSGGRLYLALATAVMDEASRNLAGGAFMVISPTIRGTNLAGTVVQQGYVVASNNHLLFPAMAVNAQGRGVISATLVGPNWYPSAVYIPFTLFSTPTTLRVAAPGLLPQDGFSGYRGSPSRWGDYSAAVVSTDGSLWVASEYIGNLPRTELANWQTFIAQFIP